MNKETLNLSQSGESTEASRLLGQDEKPSLEQATIEERPRLGLNGNLMLTAEQKSDPIDLRYEAVALNCFSQADVANNGAAFLDISQSRLLNSIKTKADLRGQRIKLLAGITMYNEDADEMQFTMRGMLGNFREMQDE